MKDADLTKDAGSQDRHAALRRSMLHSLVWSWTSVGVLVVLQLVYLAVMARLIEPSTFGVMAGAMIALKFVSYLARWGVGAALIQKPTIDADDPRSALAVSLCAGIVGAGVLVLLAPLLSNVLEQSEVKVTIRWMSLSLLLGAFTVVPEALLRRRLEFRAIAKISIGAYIFSNFVVAVPLAVRGTEVGGLIAASLVNTAVTALMLSIAAAFCPLPLFDRPRMTGFARFGGYVAIASLLDVAGSTADTIVVGRIGSSQLGQYSRATLLVSLPVEQVSAAATRVIGPGLAKIQSEPARFGSALSMSIGLTAMLVSIPVALAAATASAVVEVVLGSGWALAAKVLPYVGIASGLGLITQVIISASDAQGAVRPRLLAQTASLVGIVGVVAVAAVEFRTPLAVAIAWSVGEFTRLLIHGVLAARWLAMPVGATVWRVTSALAVATLVSGPGLVLVRYLDVGGIAVLIGSGLLGAGVLGAVWFAWPSLPQRTDLARIGLPRASRRREVL